MGLRLEKVLKLAKIISDQGFFVVTKRVFLRELYRFPLLRNAIEYYESGAQLLSLLLIFKLNADI